LFSERCERPYNGLSAEQTAVYVVTGGRLDCPADCDDHVYALMTRCWRHRADCRPSAAAVHRRLATLRLATDDRLQRRSTGATPPPPLPQRPSNSNDTPQTRDTTSTSTFPRVSSQLSETFGNLRPTSLHLSSSEELLQPRLARTDDVTSSTDVFKRNAAVRIRDSFRKFVSSRKSAPVMGSLGSPLTSPTGGLPDE